MSSLYEYILWLGIIFSLNFRLRDCVWSLGALDCKLITVGQVDPSLGAKFEICFQIDCVSFALKKLCLTLEKLNTYPSTPTTPLEAFVLDPCHNSSLRQTHPWTRPAPLTPLLRPRPAFGWVPLWLVVVLPSVMASPIGC